MAYVFENISEVNCAQPYLGPCDVHDAENADGITESSHKNGIYCLDELIKSR